MAKPHYGVWPRGWLFTETVNIFGMQFQDNFCIDRRFHITVSQGGRAFPDGGWHLSVKPTCDHKPSYRVGAWVWLPQVKRFFDEAKAWGYVGPIPSEYGLDTFHFHEDLELRARRN